MMTICWNDILDILSKIQFIIKINLLFLGVFLVNATTTELKIPYVARVTLPVYHAALEDTILFFAQQPRKHLKSGM